LNVVWNMNSFTLQSNYAESQTACVDLVLRYSVGVMVYDLKIFFMFLEISGISL